MSDVKALPLESLLVEHEPIVNDFQIMIATVNGSGSQTANTALMRSIFRMGVPVSGKNIFPSNIQGLPTWFTVRVSKDGYIARREDYQILVAMNQETVAEDVRKLAPGGVCLYPQEWKLREDRPDIIYYPMPVEKLLEASDVPANLKSYVANMVYLGVLATLLEIDLDEIAFSLDFHFGGKAKAINMNMGLVKAAAEWSLDNLAKRDPYQVTRMDKTQGMLLLDGNSAGALGAVFGGVTVAAWYPITPSTGLIDALREYLRDLRTDPVTGKATYAVIQAEDEIAACAFAIGASYTGKVAVTITSGPGYSLKQEGLGLAVMAEIPLVVVNVQRGGPSTGQPTKVEQGDLLTVMFGSHGDAPKVVMAPGTIEDCFYSMITARRLAETFNMVVVVLSDASLATAQQPFPRPQFSTEWLAPPVDQNPVPDGAKPYDWDPVTGLSRRFVPGQPNGMHTLTGLAHDRNSRVAYDPEINEQGMRARSMKLATLQKTLTPPPVFGDREGELLVVGWGGTRGAIEEAVARLRGEGHRVSSTHLTFLQPMQPGIGEILRGFRQVITVEGNWPDDPRDPLIDESNRRYSALAMLLRSRYLVDVDCWTEVRGRPIKPGTVYAALRGRLAHLETSR